MFFDNLIKEMTIGVLVVRLIAVAASEQEDGIRMLGLQFLKLLHYSYVHGRI